MGRVASFIAGQKEQSRWIRVCWLASRKDLVGRRSVIVDFLVRLSTVSFSSSSSSFCELSIGVYRNRQCSSFVFNYQFLVSSLFFLLVNFTSTVHSQDCQYPQKNASRGRATTVQAVRIVRATVASRGIMNTGLSCGEQGCLAGGGRRAIVYYHEKQGPMFNTPWHTMTGAGFVNYRTVKTEIIGHGARTSRIAPFD